MLDIRSADAERQGAERAMGGGVAVAADNGGAGQGPALFRADDVDDAGTDIIHGEIFDAEILGVLRQGRDLFAAFRIGDALVAVLGRHIMVGHRQSQFRAADLAAGVAQAFERLGAGDFMDQVTVNINKRRLARPGFHQMRIPDFVVQRLAHEFPS